MVGKQWFVANSSLFFSPSFSPPTNTCAIGAGFNTRSQQILPETPSSPVAFWGPSLSRSLSLSFSVSTTGSPLFSSGSEVEALSASSPSSPLVASSVLSPSSSSSSSSSPSPDSSDSEDDSSKRATSALLLYYGCNKVLEHKLLTRRCVIDSIWGYVLPLIEASEHDFKLVVVTDLNDRTGTSNERMPNMMELPIPVTDIA